MLLEGTYPRKSQGHPRTSMTWDYRSVVMSLEETSQDFHDLRLQKCSYVTRGDIPGSPRDIPGVPRPGTTGVQLCYQRGHPRSSMTWDYRNVAMLLEGMSQKVPGTSQDFHDLGTTGVQLCYQRGYLRIRTSEYVRNTLTSDDRPRYLCAMCLCMCQVQKNSY